MENENEQRDGIPPAAAPAASAGGDAEELARKLRAIRDTGADVVLIEVKRVIGTGRGEGGGWEACGLYEWEPASVGIGQACRELETVARQHGGGQFRLIVRDEQDGGFLMNQPLRVARQVIAPPAATPAPNAPGDAALSRLEALMAQVAEAIAKPRSLRDQLEELRALKELAGGDGGAGGKPQTLAEQLREFRELQEAIGGLGGGNGGGGEGWPQFLDRWMPRLLPLIERVGDADPDTADEVDGDEPESAAQLTERQAALVALLEKAAGGLEMAAAARMTAKQTAALALKHAAANERRVLLKLARDPKLTGALIKARPKLLGDAGFVEQVRQELANHARAGAAGKDDTGAQAGAGGGNGQGGGAPVAPADDAGADTGRPGGSGGNAVPDGEPAGARKEGAGGARARGKGDAAPAAKGQGGRGRGAARAGT